MMRPKIALGAAAAVLALAGCSAGNDSAAGGDAGTTASSPSTAEQSTAPRPVPSTSASGPTEPSASARDGVMSLAQSCRAVVADVNDGLGTLSRYAENPLNGPVTIEELDRVRTELQANEPSAPQPLRGHLNTMVGVLNSAVQGIQDGNVSKVDIKGFQQSGEQILRACSGQTS